MSIKRSVRNITIILCCAASIEVLGQIRLPGFVTDSMIIQRDVKLKVWGWAGKGEKVSVKFIGKNYNTTADSNGKWIVLLQPVKAGGPYEMNISGTNKITIRNILAGDVWFCSGQSNMVHFLELHKERYAEEIATADYPQIRQFLVPTLTNLQQAEDDVPRGHWKPATASGIRRFSVVAYFFARDLYEKYHIPIGLINASVGGTPIEAWTSEQGLKTFPASVDLIQKNRDTSYVNTTNRIAASISRVRSQLKPIDKGLETKPWFDTTYVPVHWRAINIPGYWEDQGIKELDGVVWYRKEIQVPTSMTAIPAKIAMGRIVDADFVYVNGTLVGSTSYQYPQRRYQLNAGILKPGKNIIVIRVLNQSGKGGFVPDKPYYLSAGEQTIDLRGAWQYQVGEVYASDQPAPKTIALQNQPTALFNGMVAPFTNYAIKGVLWYQGEANTNSAKEYERLLPGLIKDWRENWKQSDLPFLYVQLPNFMEMNYSPSESKWAELREAQLKSLRVPNTAMAVAIDLGEWNDIHPGNKKPIGERLALAARKVAYGENIVFSGPLFQSSTVDGDKIILTFSNTGSGLTTIDGEEPGHFSIAGTDKKFVWARAKIENNTVIVWSEKVSHPVYVRYAWADNPQGANVYNKEGLPASPFRTDQ